MKLGFRRWGRAGPYITGPHLLIYAVMAFAVMAGMWDLNRRTDKNCAAQVYALRVILQEIPPSDDPDVQETIDELNELYAKQYHKIVRFIDGDSCTHLLPKNAPPPLTAP